MHQAYAQYSIVASTATSPRHRPPILEAASKKNENYRKSDLENFAIHAGNVPSNC
jgi:hypothetical protein